MLPLFWSFVCVCVCKIWQNLTKRTVMFLDGLKILGFDDNGSNSAQESSPNKESNDSSTEFQ